MSQSDDGLRIVVAAEPLEDGAGLAMFLLDSLEILARSRPGWEFVLLVMSSFSDAESLKKFPNVKILFCDNIGWRGFLTKMLPKFRGRKRILDLAAEISPTRFLRREFGNLEEVWRTIGFYDAVWVPHFAISQDRWPALYRPGTIKAPVLLTIHDLHPAAFPDEWEMAPKMVENFWKKFRPFAQRAGAVITHSNFQRQAIIEHFGVDPARISVTHLPLPLNELLTMDYSEPMAESILREFQVNRPYIFCPMSQVVVHKNHRRTIEAWSMLRDELRDKLPQLVFTNHGNPQDLANFRAIIEREGLTGKIIFTGKISREKLAILYRNCLALLSPTLYEGGGSGPVMEAVMAGRPVLCSDIPPIREQLSRFGLKAMYFDPYSPAEIARVVMDFLEKPEVIPFNDPETIRQRLPKDREELARTYTQAFIRIIEKQTR